MGLYAQGKVLYPSMEGVGGCQLPKEWVVKGVISTGECVVMLSP